MHSIYERFFKGELDFFDVCDEYEHRYSEQVFLKFPPNKFVDLNKKYYQSGLDALEDFTDIPSAYECLHVECKINTYINDIHFVGYIDLILRNTITDEIIIVDHKSKAKFKSKREQKEYARQLYLYSIYIKEKYGRYPKYLVFNMFRIRDVVKIEFNENDFQEAIDWFIDTVSEIYLDYAFDDKIALEYEALGKDILTFDKKDFFCNELCGVREYCPRSTCMKKNDHRKKSNRKSQK